MNVNEVILLGYTGKDPEVKEVAEVVEKFVKKGS